MNRSTTQAKRLVKRIPALPMLMILLALLSHNWGWLIPSALAARANHPSTEPLKVYVLRGGDPASDNEVIRALQERGHIATPGVETPDWTGAQANLNDFDAVVILHNSNWGRALPAAGAQAIRDYVVNGGGLVTGEWFMWAAFAYRADALLPLLPVEEYFSYNGSSPTTYTQLTPDPIINSGVPPAFTFPLGSFAGTESCFVAKPGATVFYSSSNGGGSAGAPGLVGWDVKGGRVASFSTLLSATELADANYRRLFVNAVEWAALVRSDVLQITSVSPNKGGNAGAVTVAVQGSGFKPGVGVRLMEGGQVVLAGLNTAVGSRTRLRTTFDLRNQLARTLRLEVVNPDGSSASATTPFIIENGGQSQVWVDILGRDTIRIGRQQAFSIGYGNHGSIDASEEHFIILSWPVDAEIVVDGATTPYRDPLPPPIIEASQKTISILVPEIPAQSSSYITVQLTTSSGSREMSIRAAIVSSRSFETPPSSTTQAGAPTIRFAETTASDNQPPPIGSHVYLGPNEKNLFGHEAVVGVDSNGQIVIWDHFAGRDPVTGRIVRGDGTPGRLPLTLEEWKSYWGGPYLGWGTPPGWTPAKGIEIARLAEDLIGSGKVLPDPFAGKNARGDGKYSCAGICEYIDERAGFNPLPETFFIDRERILPAMRYRLFTGRMDFYISKDTPESVVALIFGLDKFTNTTGSLLELLHRLRLFKEKVLQIVASRDPNEKSGSLGIGELRYLLSTEPLRYSILFENVATATASAQEIVIADQLDIANLDLSAISFGPIVFGNRQLTPPSGSKQFTAGIDLRPAKNLIVKVSAALDTNTGLLTWRFTSIDPATGGLPEDPLAGFLPPNRTSPEGEGSVTFTIKPKNGLPSGTQIRNRASIVFDANPPIETREWLNTLDNTKPNSQVFSLAPTQTSTNFAVQWSGEDEGSGVLDYTIFVSENGGSYKTWLSNITDTSGTFAGQPGKTYAFYSVARDGTGNIEDAPATADATTQVALAGADLSISQSVSTNPVTVGSNITYTITVTNNGPGPANSVMVTDNLPVQTLFVSCSATADGVCGGSRNNRTVTFASLAAGASATITLAANIDCRANDRAALNNTASVSASTSDSTSGNNSTTVMTSVLNPTMISPQMAYFTASGGTGNIDVASPAGCGFGTGSDVNWFRVNSISPVPGSGVAKVSYVVDANPGTARTATMSVNGQTFTIEQVGASSEFAVSGQVTANGVGVPGLAMIFIRVSGEGALPASVRTDANGNWNQTGFQVGATYRVTLDHPPYLYSPAQYDFSGPRAGLNFTRTSTSDDCGGLPISIGQTVNGALSVTNCSTPVRGYDYYVNHYSFSGQADQWVAISLNSSAFDTYLYLAHPDGRTIQDDNGSGGTNSRIPAGRNSFYRLPSSGTYVIGVTSFTLRSTGNYTLSLTGITAGPAIGLSSVPEYCSFDDLKGQAWNLNPANYKVAVYIQVAGWFWPKPNYGNPFTTPRQPDGSWTCDITTGGIDETARKVVAYLLPNDCNLPPPSSGPALPPEIEQCAVAKVEATRAPVPPLMISRPASAISRTSVTLNGEAHAKCSAANAWFEWGTSSNLASFNSTPARSIGAGNGGLAFNANLSGLTPGATYYYRLAGSNIAGQARGAILSFTTPAAAGLEQEQKPNEIPGQPNPLQLPNGARVLRRLATQTVYKSSTRSAPATGSKTFSLPH